MVVYLAVEKVGLLAETLADLMVGRRVERWVEMMVFELVDWKVAVTVA